MKKNITINLCGRLFSIDEDAYMMLSTYEQSLRNYFRSREGDEEIADDIEERIAELFEELKQGGTEAITIEHVTEIIHRIGRPEEMDSPTSDRPTPDPSRNGGESGNGETTGKGAKRLYRDPLDKKMMGVLSGLATYFGGDVLWWRLGYLGAILFSFVGSTFNFLWWLPGHSFFFNIQFWGVALIVGYIALAILVPEANTPEDHLRMKGREINPQNLAEEVTKESPTSSPMNEGKYNKEGGHYHSSGESESFAATTPPPSRKGFGREASGCIGSTLGCIGGFFTAIWAVVSTLFRWCIYTFGAFVAIMCIVGMVCLIAIALNPTDTILSGKGFAETAEFAAIVSSLRIPLYVFVIAALFVLAITAYAIIHSLLNEFRQMPPMPYSQRIALLVMWFVSLIVAGSAIGYGVPKLIKGQQEWHKTSIELTPDLPSDNLIYVSCGKIPG